MINKRVLTCVLACAAVLLLLASVGTVAADGPDGLTPKEELGKALFFDKISEPDWMACAVCHYRKDPADKSFSFVWVDRVTGITSRQVKGEYGRYPAKIFPARSSGAEEVTIIHPVNEQSAREFMELKDQFTPDQMAEAKIKLHEQISQKPVFCIDCHKKDGYLDFSKLGFPKNRVNHLISTEVASMIANYETFYLPEVIDFGSE